MRWSLQAATIVLAVFLAANGTATEIAPRATRAELPTQDSQPAPAIPAAELARQDRSVDNRAKNSTLKIRPTNDPQPAVVERDEPHLIFREPIGIRIDYNPYGTSASPSSNFSQRLENLTLQAMPAERVYELPPIELPRNLPPSMGAAFQPPAPTVEEASLVTSVFQPAGEIYIDHGVFRAAFQQPLAPLQPLQPVQPPSVAPYQPNIPTTADTLGTTSIAELAAAVGGSPAQGVNQQQSQAIAPTDIGALLQSANSVQSVNTTRRSPVALAPTVRGFKFGEIYAQATGAYWFPVREDLDSMLSKIDPGMIQEVVVIPGPYGLRYGPGFSFIDIITQDTPRYQDGSGSDYRANGNIRTNGGQLYGRLTADGGGDDYGYRVSYGHRKGSDYEAGNGLLIPSGYDSGDVWAQYGFNTGKYQRVEASFLRLDGSDIQYAAQFFDVDTFTPTA